MTFCWLPPGWKPGYANRATSWRFGKAAKRSRTYPVMAHSRAVGSSAAEGIPEPSSRYPSLLNRWVVTSETPLQATGTGLIHMAR